MPENAAKRQTRGRHRDVAPNGLGTCTGLETTVTVIKQPELLEP